MEKIKSIEKAPKEKDFQHDYPNIGYKRSEERLAYVAWMEKAEKYIKYLEHHRDTTVGLWATDDLGFIEREEDGILFEIKG